MLPAPAVFSRRRDSRSRSIRPQNPLFLCNLRRQSLLQRARITNLGLLLLMGLASLSLIINFSHYFSGSTPAAFHRRRRLLPIGAKSELEHLIIVPGHAIWIGSDLETALHDNDWILEEYQKGGGRPAAFYEHIKYATRLAANDRSALVIFSGGQTRNGSTGTEGESYFRLALHSNLTTFTQATTENFALDSYQNLLFSIARFHEFTGHYPSAISVVGYEFKRRRFEELHREAVKWPATRFHYYGIDAAKDNADATAGELQRSYIPFSTDLYGCHQPLVNKRLQRNPHLRFHSYFDTAPEMADLLDHCPEIPDLLFNGPLPWDNF